MNIKYYKFMKAYGGNFRQSKYEKQVAYSSFSRTGNVNRKKRSRSTRDKDNVNIELERFGFDTQANVSYVGDKSLLHNYRSLSGMKVNGLGGDVIVSGSGTLRVSSPLSNGGTFKWELHNVLYIKGCDCNIIAGHDFMDNVIGTKHLCVPKTQDGEPYVKMCDHTKLRLKKKNGVTVLEGMIVESTTSNNTLSSFTARVFSSVCYASGRDVEVDINYAHMLLCHPSKKKMTYCLKHNLLKGLSWKNGDLNECYPCAIGKTQLKNKRHSSTKYRSRGELIVTDIEGPMDAQSFDGYRYAVHFTDMYSRYSVVYFMKRKSEVGKCFELYINEHCIPRGVKIQTVQSDNAGEYVGTDGASTFQSIIKRYKIAFRSTSAYCHWENGVAERVIRTMMEKSFTLMAQRDLAPAYWALCLQHVYKVNNYLPHSYLNDEDSPYHRWFDDLPDCKDLHSFGCDVRAGIPLDKSSKRKKYSDAPAYMGIYVGFDDASSSHLIYRPGIGGAKGNVNDVGDRLCKFFEAYDPNNFMKPHDHPDYNKYLPQTVPSKSDAVPILTKNSCRIVKTFNKDKFFGTATPDKESGEYAYNIVYDDGDLENMTTEEFNECKAACKLLDDDPRSQLGYSSGEFDLLPRKFKVKEILDHKIIIDSSNRTLGCMKIKYATDGKTSREVTAWVNAGTLMFYCSNINSLWCKLRSYMDSSYVADDDKSRFSKNIFHYFSAGGPRGGTTRGSRGDTRLNMLSYMFDPDTDEVFSISASQSKVVKGIDQLISPMSRQTLRIEKDTPVPNNYPQALQYAGSQWVDATKRCIADLGLAKVGKWVRLCDVKVKTISSRFVYQAKVRPGNVLEAFCRWTPRGFEEIPDEHYDPDKIFSSTPQLWVLRIIIIKVLKCRQKLDLKVKSFHLDFKRAFSHAPLKERIHVTMPPKYFVYDDQGYELCLQLDKSSEGLKQSSANWSNMLDSYLIQEGFVQNIKEPKLFKKQIPNKSWVYLEVYVDDLYGCCNDDKWLDQFWRKMNDELAPCKYLGEVSHALGIDVEWSADGESVTLSTAGKIDDLLIRHNMIDCKGRFTPLSPGCKLADDLDSPLLCPADQKKYRSIVGSLMYVTRCNRPDTAYAAWYLACGMQKPTEAMMLQAMHCLRYLRQTRKVNLVYSVKSSEMTEFMLDLSGITYNPDDLTGFCDANWLPKRSVSSTILMCCNASLFWRVRKQKSVALSSVQAELSALSSEAQDVELVQDVFSWMDIDFVPATVVYCDNRGAIQNANHPCLSDRLRHLPNKMFYIREVIKNGKLLVKWIAGAVNPADLGTKSLGGLTHRIYAEFLMNCKLGFVTTRVQVKKISYMAKLTRSTTM